MSFVVWFFFLLHIFLFLILMLHRKAWVEEVQLLKKRGNISIWESSSRLQNYCYNFHWFIQFPYDYLHRKSNPNIFLLESKTNFLITINSMHTPIKSRDTQQLDLSVLFPCLASFFICKFLQRSYFSKLHAQYTVYVLCISIQYID